MESANPSCSTSNREFLDLKKKEEIESWLGDSRIVDSFEAANEIEYFDTFPTLEELEYHEWLLKYPKPSWVKAKIRTGNLNNIKISCKIEDLGSIIDSGLSEVVLGQSFAHTSKLTYDELLGLIRLYLTRRSLEVLRKFHWMILGGRFNQYFAFGRHLEEIHVTWAHLEKKQTRLQTYTNIAQEFLFRTASQITRDAVTTISKTALQDLKTASDCTTQLII
ncbi:hypothetical protein Tco_1123205 [Tanacetum coccineum]|uniref:Uncharacterized protein n=1 Tax=Tanacetum coccineum TaxID=301880 RepID=A0ABQ5J432_9ASTR